MCFEGAAQTPQKRSKIGVHWDFCLFFFLLLNAFNIFTKDICWHSYDILSSSILNRYLTEKPQQQAESGFKWELPTRANSGHIGMVGKISILIRRPCEQRRGMMEWRCCSRAAPSYWKPAARVRDRNAQEPCGVAAATAATCKTQAEQTTGINQPYDNSATCSAMQPSAHTLRMKRFPPHTQAPASSFPIMWRITNWDETNLFFFFFILGVSQVVGSNLWLVVNSWVLIKARPEFTVLQIEVVH